MKPCKFCEKSHDPSVVHDYVGKCRMQGCPLCETAYELHCRARNSARAAGIRLTRDDPDDSAGQCGECRVPAYAGIIVPTSSVPEGTLGDFRQSALFKSLPPSGPGVRVWAWLQDVAAKGGAQWSVEDRPRDRPPAKCPRCRKRVAA